MNIRGDILVVHVIKSQISFTEQGSETARNVE